ncbi:MAG TPA: hypothetical protein VJ608_11280 [Albitalea sp.]|nr:hypothetical protein [Albitalea sp.]
MTSPIADVQELSRRLEWEEISSQQFVDEFARIVTSAIGCSRAGVRALVETDDGAALRTVAMFDSRDGTSVRVPDIQGAEVLPFLKMLGRHGGCVVPDVGENAMMKGLLQSYKGQWDVRSTMNACVTVNGLVHGEVACEQVDGFMQWSPRQLYLLRQLATRASPALVRVIAERITAPGALSDPIPLEPLGPET